MLAYSLAGIFLSGYVRSVSGVFQAIAEPSRRQIIGLLRSREHNVGELVAATGLSQPSVSKQLRVLREHDLVTVRQQANLRWYGLRAEPLRELDEWLTPYRHLWRGKLEALQTYLDKEAARDQP
jgi:DNA-binding transcriptional ArsR family regulator